MGQNQKFTPSFLNFKNKNISVLIWSKKVKLGVGGWNIWL